VDSIDNEPYSDHYTPTGDNHWEYLRDYVQAYNQTSTKPEYNLASTRGNLERLQKIRDRWAPGCKLMGINGGLYLGRDSSNAAVDQLRRDCLKHDALRRIQLEEFELWQDAGADFPAIMQSYQNTTGFVPETMDRHYTLSAVLYRNIYGDRSGGGLDTPRWRAIREYNGEPVEPPPLRLHVTL
jgi:hypothetical protein